jgi:hypothetical protein
MAHVKVERDFPQLVVDQGTRVILTAAKDLIRSEVELKRQENIDIDAIVEEEGLFDLGHRDGMIISMLQSRGQISPVTVRARLDGGKVAYDIIDGFHRASGLKEIQQDFRTCGPLVQIALNLRSEYRSYKGKRKSNWQNDGLARKVNDKTLTAKAAWDIVQGKKKATSYGLTKGEAKELREWFVEKQDMRAEAVVLYGCNDEELFDLRVLAASSVKSIKFARMAMWMQMSFEYTKWKSKEILSFIKNKDLTLSQVFAMAHRSANQITKEPGKNLGVSNEAAEELIAWAVQKARRWDRPLAVLLQDMRAIEVASPELVMMVRQGGGGTDGKGVFTRARFVSIVNNLPNEWEVQERLAHMAIDKNILASDLGILSGELAEALRKKNEVFQERIFNNPDLYLRKHQVARVIEKGKGAMPNQTLKSLQTIVDKAIENPDRKPRIGLESLTRKIRVIDEMNTPIVKLALENLGINYEKGASEGYPMVLIRQLMQRAVGNSALRLEFSLNGNKANSAVFVPGQKEIVIGENRVSLTEGQSVVLLTLLLTENVQVTEGFLRKVLSLAGLEDQDPMKVGKKLVKTLSSHARRMEGKLVMKEGGIIFQRKS